MKKSIHRAICFLFAVLAVCALFPVSAFAVDPVSAGVMANAFAQAIAAYGASNGVAMTFDVANTDGIGETVHELWQDFRNDTADADDYATLAAALFPDLYYKAASAVGGASDVYTVGYNISSTYAEEFDKFYNWLLSGPAEMTKVDNEYFQFQQAQIGANSTSIPVGYGSYVFSLNGHDISSVPYSWTYRSNKVINLTSSMENPCVFFVQVAGATTSLYVCFASTQQSQGMVYSSYNFAGSTVDGPGNYSTIVDIPYRGFYWGYKKAYWSTSQETPAPLYSYSGSLSTQNDFKTMVTSLFDLQVDNNTLETNRDTIGVKAYDQTGVASFPDTTDPNYEAVGKRIPSDIPWDDSAFGDGTGALTGAQSGAIAAEGDAVIADDGVLSLAGSTTADPGPGDDDPPSNDPDDYLAVGLADLFPFCIPFDIYNFLSALAADPVAPHFTATLAFPQAVGGIQTIELDFDSPTWNQLAQLLRLLELLAFIVGLALLTRSMFIRG